jgi:hypothetical protein
VVGIAGLGEMDLIADLMGVPLTTVARLALTRVLRQARLVGPEAIAGIPVQRHVLLDPGGSHITELVERMMHRL